MQRSGRRPALDVESCGDVRGIKEVQTRRAAKDTKARSCSWSAESGPRFRPCRGLGVAVRELVGEQRLTVDLGFGRKPIVQLPP